MREGWYALAPEIVVRPFDVKTSANALLVEGTNGARWEISAATGVLIARVGTVHSVDELAASLASELHVRPGNEQLMRHLDGLVAQGILVRTGDRTAGDLGGDIASPRVTRTRLASLNVRATLVPERLAGWLATPLQWLMTPAVFWPALSVLVVGTVAAWVIAGGSRVIAPQRLFVGGTVALAAIGGILHELGHVAAARRFGAAHGRIGIGFYLVFPVFFVELDDVWRLSRMQRSIVDLAGIFMQLLFAVATLLFAHALGDSRVDFLMVAQAAFIASAVNAVVNLNPVFRFDGYWLVGDALGIANLRSRSLALLQSLAKGATLARALDNVGVRALNPRVVWLLLVYAGLSSVLLSWWLIRLLIGIPHFVNAELLQAIRAFATSIAAHEVPAPNLWFAVGVRAAVLLGLSVALGTMLRRIFRSLMRKSPLPVA